MDTKYNQCRNRRNNIIVTYQGREMCLKDASANAGLGLSTVRLRLKSGWSLDEALTIPAVLGNNQGLKRNQNQLSFSLS
jgi:hypothetical protein